MKPRSPFAQRKEVGLKLSERTVGHGNGLWLLADLSEGIQGGCNVVPVVALEKVLPEFTERGEALSSSLVAEFRAMWKAAMPARTAS